MTEAYSQHLLEVMKGPLSSGELSDLTITAIDFPIGKVCEDSTINLPDDEPVIMSLMKFIPISSFDYRTQLTSVSPSDFRTHASQRRFPAAYSFPSVLIILAAPHVTTAASTSVKGVAPTIPSTLTIKSITRSHVHLFRYMPFEHVYTTTPDSDMELREITTYIIPKHTDSLVENQEVEDLMMTHKGLAVGLVNTCNKRSAYE
ncbi:hypothetical protein CC78DRAFT_579785 [Lojkania enalia]|uniref:Uncharacterized protein n=1 Tax=Lojkania enalia TaxID=147567 RepID=A0A9P4KCF0_9PLEO|nr:hypothetical protein CC78DRAFT_579785 [Didymosphaeria enalia]